MAAASPASAAPTHQAVEAPAHDTSATLATIRSQSLHVVPVGLAPLAAATMPATMATGTTTRSLTRRRFIRLARLPEPQPTLPPPAQCAAICAPSVPHPICAPSVPLSGTPRAQIESFRFGRGVAHWRVVETNYHSAMARWGSALAVGALSVLAACSSGGGSDAVETSIGAPSVPSSTDTPTTTETPTPPPPPRPPRSTPPKR